MTPAELDAIEARANAATEGPWEWGEHHADTLYALGQYDDEKDGHSRPRSCRSDGWAEDDPHANDECGCLAIVETDGGFYPPRGDDGPFIAHSRTDIPALVAEVRRLGKLVEDAYYEGQSVASEGWWVGFADSDAKRALEGA